MFYLICSAATLNLNHVFSLFQISREYTTRPLKNKIFDILNTCNSLSDTTKTRINHFNTFYYFL
jgi:hypothetical protein